jgi:hypothetical protein
MDGGWAVGFMLCRILYLSFDDKLLMSGLLV